jgi:uncharacterized membrane protein
MLRKTAIFPKVGARDTMSAPDPSSALLHPRESLITLAHVIYALHAFSAFTAFLSSALIIVAFLTGWPSIIAVILNYVKRSEVQGTWLDSHFGWQICTFWYALLWLLLGGVAFVTFVDRPGPSSPQDPYLLGSRTPRP